MRVLHIVGSPRGQRSRSRAIAEHFLEHLGSAQVETLDLWRTDLPPLDGAMLESRYHLINGGGIEPAFAERWAELRARVDHLLSFDLWLFSTPMWNFGLPYRVKHYLDLVIQPTMAFTNDSTGAVTSHGAGKTAVIVASGALDTRSEGAIAHFDHSARLLADNLAAYFGLDDIRIVRIMPTFGDPAAVEAETARARDEALALALNLAGRAGEPG